MSHFLDFSQLQPKQLLVLALVRREPLETETEARLPVTDDPHSPASITISSATITSLCTSAFP